MRSRYSVLGASLGLILGVGLLFTGCSGAAATNTMLAPTPMPSATPAATPSPVPSPSASPTPAPAVASRFIYAILDFEASGGYFGGAINSSTGQVTPLAANPFVNTLGQNVVIQVIADPSGRFLYSLNLGAFADGMEIGKPGINEYQINRANGDLQPVPNGDVVFTSGVHDAQLAIDGKGKFLYEPDGSAIDIYSIDQSSGLLTPTGSSSAADPAGNFSAASPDGRFLFNSGGGTVEVFAIDPTTGQLSLAGSAPTGGTAGTTLVSPDSTLLFVANAGQGTLSVFHIGTNGMLTPVAGSPFAIDTQAEAMSPSPDSRFLYITFGVPSSPSHVQGYALDATGGHLTAIPGAAVANATSVSVDGSGKFAYLSLNPGLATYAIDPTTGALTPISQASQPWTDNPPDIVVTP
jgi:6-phosphogluconolactonase (cycloisomerase 2 family)